MLYACLTYSNFVILATLQAILIFLLALLCYIRIDAKCEADFELDV